MLSNRPLTSALGNPPVLFIHGLFSRPAFMQPWVDRFEAAGHVCHSVGLPGRDPTDLGLLRRATLDDYSTAVEAARDRLGSPPIVIGHSLGGLLGQRLAARSECAALVLLASVPPGVLWAQPRALPHLVRLLPAILAGRAVLPSDATMRSVPLSTLDRAEQDAIVPGLVPDSGRVFRSMVFGSSSTRVESGAVTCPVLCISGAQDRNVAARTSRSIAARYDAHHEVHPTAPHWIVAESLIDQIAPAVLRWIEQSVARRRTPDPAHPLQPRP